MRGLSRRELVTTVGRSAVGLYLLGASVRAEDQGTGKQAGRVAQKMARGGEAIPGEIYHVSSNGLPAVRTFTVDDATAAQFHLKPGTRAESKTWKATVDPWVVSLTNGQVGLTISNILVTALRAMDTSGQLHCLLTCSEYWTTGWGATYYNDNPGIPFQFSYENSAGGRLRWWDMGRTHSVCGMNLRPMNFSEAFEPNIYDIFVGWTRYLGQTTFFKC